ncbi:uncharacterized protein LOC135833993 [Planococcus citri]|uniref:uncharacterized protein LOC135833992 n=1 Tax=Planococcus citri TaxID=170843 RepID=UPI0031FA3A7A
MNGSKLIMMKHKQIEFKDSLNFFHTRLAALPDMFGIEDAEKGYFPHYFNTLPNQNYCGSIPEAKYYGMDEMGLKERKKFEEWYNDQKSKNVTFNFQEEIRKYCIADVNVLRKSCIKFRKLFYDLMGIDPLAATSTIASACMTAYRTNFIPPNTIPLMTFPSYRMRDNQSMLAVRYLKYFEDMHGVQLESAYRGWEKQIGKYKVDGYHPSFPMEKLGPVPEDMPSVRPLIIEINGCYYHGCPKCFANRTTAVKSKDSKEYVNMDMRYKNTLKKLEHLLSLPEAPYVITKWECEIYNECRSNPTLKHYMTNVQIPTPIYSNREPFFGGRTENFYWYYRVDPEKNEKIRYLDVNSLYPYVNKTCASEENKLACNHSDNEREIMGTYTCIELNKAVEKGYQIKEIYEVWAYKSTKYNIQTNSGGLFVNYINTFLKIKQEASGFPPHVQSDDDKRKFIEEMKLREGVTLDLEKIEPNPGLRSLSKLCLNSLWGKFGQRNNQRQVKVIKDGPEFFEYFSNPAIDITDTTFVTDDLVYVHWEYLEETAIDTPFINPVLSAHVTAEARLVLYSYLEKLQDRVLYCDTDSIIYIERPGDEQIETGPYLGQMGNELEKEGEGAYITEFISGLNDLPDNILEKILDSVYWKQYYTTLPYVSQRLQKSCIERIFKIMHPKTKASKDHTLVVDNYKNRRNGRNGEIIINRFRRGLIPCNCLSKQGRKKEVRYIKRYVIELKVGRPFFNDDHDTGESDLEE